LFAPPEPNATIADTEGIEVVWCTKKGYGTRIIPDGTLLGLQVLKNNDYTMITGFIDQTKINIQAGDPGGELDSGAQDGVRTLTCTRLIKADEKHSALTLLAVWSTPTTLTRP
jgi:hypothetical protein